LVDFTRGFYELPAAYTPTEIYLKTRIRVSSGVAFGVRTDLLADVISMTGTGALTVNGVSRGTPLALVEGTWYCLEFHILMADAGGLVEYRVNGILYDTYSGDTKPASGTYLRYVRGTASSSDYIEMDDIAVNIPSGDRETSWCGIGHLRGLKPNGVGVYDNWNRFPDTGEATYEDLADALPDDDATYAQAQVLSIPYTFTCAFEDPPAGSFRVRAVSLIPYAEQVYPSLIQVRPMTRRAVPPEIGTYPAMDAVFSTYQGHHPIIRVFDRDWSIAELSETEVGLVFMGD
jgi:hypothetical protein